MKLNPEQQQAKQAILNGRNTCIMGAGGCGKSYLIDDIMKEIRRDTIVIAPTGKAALNVGGMTCHSALGLPIGYPQESDVYKVSRKAQNIFSGNAVKRIVMDEAFMIRSDMFALMDWKLRYMKNKLDQPFGGLQIIAVGDPMQLEPVIKSGYERQQLHSKMGGKYCFNTSSWADLNIHYAVLSKIERTSDDEFKSMLDRIRFGRELSVACEWFNDVCYGKVQPDENAMNIVTTNAVADVVNRRALIENNNELHTNNGVVWGDMKANDAPVPIDLKLKVGLRVCAVANSDDYVNGSMGFIESIVNKKHKLEVRVKFDNGGVYIVEPFKWEKIEYRNVGGNVDKIATGSFIQIPLIQADAMTVHRLQGSTLNSANIDLSGGSFACGQTYVALSRLTNVERLVLKQPLKVSDIKVDSVAVGFYDWALSNKL